MKILRRLVLFMLLLVSLFCFLLLLNVTAPNPTGRRYSSEPPLITGQGNTQAIGLSGELILAKDLRLPRNEQPDQRQCMCSLGRYTPSRNECLVCFASSDQISTYRRPDFVGPGFIAESKNARNLLYTGREVDQIGDYVLIARLLGYPLWVFVRTHTLVDAEFTRLVQSTGGDVVYYFTTPDFSDAVDGWAARGLLTALALFILVVLVEKVLSRPKRLIRIRPATPPAPPRRVNYLRQADDAEDFLKRRKDKLKRQIDHDDD